MAGGLITVSAQAATPRADIARPTDFASVEPGTSVLQCKSNSLMTCGRQATGRMSLPKGSAAKDAYRFVEETFLFDTGVGIFLQTATAKDKTQHIEWRRRLAFRQGANGGFQLLQVGMQYRCAGGEWGKTVCKPPASKAAARPSAADKQAVNQQAAEKLAAKKPPVQQKPATPAVEGKAAEPGGESAAAAAVAAGGAAGRDGAATAGVPSATGQAPVREQGAASLPSTGRAVGEGQQTPPLDAQWRPLDQGPSKAAGQPGSASAQGASKVAPVVQGQPSAVDGMGEAVSRAEQADSRRPQHALPGRDAARGGGAAPSVAQPSEVLGAGQAGRAGAAGAVAGAGVTPATGGAVDEQVADPMSDQTTGQDVQPGTRSATGPGGLIRLMPTLPAAVRTANGFSPLVLSTEDAVRLSKPCEQPIELCGQRVFDEVFSPESYAELEPAQIQRESFIYADSPITSAVYLVTMVNLPDDSLAAERIRIEFVRRGAAWVAVSAARQMRCRRGESAVPSNWTDGVCP
ncbi:MAG: hypothetical protein Q4D91_10895 [Lautropia sp.]|nr:hypothetical protein [Lautropia sp.]